MARQHGYLNYFSTLVFRRIVGFCLNTCRQPADVAKIRGSHEKHEQSKDMFFLLLLVPRKTKPILTLSLTT